MQSNSITLVQMIDQVLPQTQCGLCGHRAGCLPYAQAIIDGEDANKCVPGGQPVADEIATLINRPKLTAEPSIWEIQADGRPQRMKAVIRENECIGCTKCISACPVDAIIGSGKLMHTIIESICTGCELCLEPCPVDCIELVSDNSPIPTPIERIEIQNDLRERYKAHLLREQIRHEQRLSTRPVTRAMTEKQHLKAILGENQIEKIAPTTESKPISNAKTTIELAKIRSQIKKLQKQLTMQADTSKQQQLQELEQRLDQLMQAS